MVESLFPKEPALPVKPDHSCVFSMSSASSHPPIEEDTLWRPSYRDIKELNLVMLLGERKTFEVWMLSLWPHNSVWWMVVWSFLF